MNAETTTNRRSTRILVAVDESPDGLAALEMAAALAAGLPGELAGLFVEDDRLVRAAGLPFSRELGIGTAQSRPLALADVELQFAAVARQLRAALESTARRARLRWSFEVARGAIVRQTLARAEQVDFVVIGRHSLMPRAFDLSRSRPTASRTESLFVLFNGDTASRRMLAAAARLAHDLHARLDVFLSARTNLGVADLQRQAVELLEGEHAVACVHPQPIADASTLIETARRLGPRLVFVGATDELLDEAFVERLVSELHCPVAIGYA